MHAINQVIACSLIYNRNLACDEGIKLDCYDVITVTGDHGMIIITMGKLYFVLSCRFASTDVASMQHKSCAGRGATDDSIGSQPSSGVGSEATWDKLLVDF
jgi:hypothetical protein